MDIDDLPIIAGKTWYALKVKNGFYAATNAPQVEGKRGKTILMHALIMGLNGCDHKDGNGLNNSRSNLRPATKSQNAANCKRRDTSSIHQGVNWDKHRGKWAAYIRIGGKSKNLGRFDLESEAAAAYVKAAIPVYGEFVYQAKV